MLCLKIYIGFSILTFVLLIMQSYIITKDLERKYPDVIKQYLDKNKTNILEKIFSYTLIFVGCFVPIVNIGIFYTSLFESDKTKEKFLAKASKEVGE